MKDKRNCGANYPIYQPPMMPFIGMPNPYQMGYNQGYTTNSISSNTLEQQLNNLEQQVNNLESRVTRLENMNNINIINNNKYNNSNYYMV